MIYSVDTSVLIEAWRRRFPPDVLPVVWRRLEGLVSDGVLIATEEVYLELQQKDDEVTAWARARESMFVPLDEAIQLKAREILAAHPRLVGQNKTRNRADPFVIALGALKGCPVVTEEQSKPTAPKIPDVCAALGVRCMNLIDLFRELKVRFD